MVNGSGIHYEAVFRALPAPVALLTTDLVYADVNVAFTALTGRSREQLVGKYIFDVFPDNPGDADASGMRNLEASLRRVAATGERDTMALQRYDVEDPTGSGVWEERYWSPVNTPVLGPGGEVALILHRVEEVTELIRGRAAAAGGDRARVLEAELYSRARELQEVNERLRQSHAREHEVALSLQAAMLPAPVPLGRRNAAVRYRPAVGALNVCGDWYDLAELPDDRLAVAVGDVVGHGLAAAGVMGQLRSALSAASRVAQGPGRALDVLGLYARSVEGAESSTAFLAVVDWADRTVAYSSAGHPPAALVHPDATVEFLDGATDPPLGARPEHVDRPQATAAFTAGASLVLYTDGLVERRDEDIETSLQRLAGSLTRHHGAGPELLADAVLADLLPTGGATDDTALIVIGL
ncbi:PP2C family protein-serine/threonine phosphatase [Streptomyces sp. NBC_00083]|uniref:PP2C family protein-serine/threonine phosphatase n=1 Tax=Streptomyces sp. NBC_00083 TaxID=2975647 RepID=UPI00224FFDDE|nr:SpoIIE family protein phosphatase [Streptomyces sp. NBC_00083]MCX5387146.1 SpoIIE family protein phosphatase [Streptomyces sp. NBC_00083]